MTATTTKLTATGIRRAINMLREANQTDIHSQDIRIEGNRAALHFLLDGGLLRYEVSAQFPTQGWYRITEAGIAALTLMR